MSWRFHSVLVTGATGLLGSQLVRELLNGDTQVVALVRDEVPLSEFHRNGSASRCTIVHGDLSRRDLVERCLLEYSIEAVFHLAAQTQVGVARKGPFHTLESNVRGTYALLDAVRSVRPNAVVVVASSDKAYGTSASLPYTEDMPLLASDIYDASKAAADVLARSFADTFGIPIVVTRCTNLFGPGDLNWERLVPGTIRSLLRGAPPIIRSDGSPIRDFLYVEDAVAGCLAAASSAPENVGESFNLASETPMRVREVVAKISELVGSTLTPKVLATATGEIQDQWASGAKARARLKWRPKVTLEDALSRTIAWYETFLSGQL